METLRFIAVVVLAITASSSPVDTTDNGMAFITGTKTDSHSIQRRFINPLFSYGGADNEALQKIRTKRSEDACEQLQLCKLHARANRNFFAAFQLYFVNKENARQWDHHTRSSAACDRRYSECYYR